MAADDWYTPQNRMGRVRGVTNLKEPGNKLNSDINIKNKYGFVSSVFLSDRATSAALGLMMLLAITLILAVLLLLLIPFFNINMEELKVPAIFKITNIRHTNEQGYLNYDSYMVVMNTATQNYKKTHLYAKTYKNGELLKCAIPTLNGHKFIEGSHHYDVQILGSKGETWYSGERIYIDYEDRTFSPGDFVTFEVYDRKTDQIISRDLFRA